MNTVYSPEKIDGIRMRITRYEDINDYLKIEFDSFYEKIGPVYGNQRDGAYRIIRAEMIDNLDSGRYLNAVYNGKILGIIKIVTRENSKDFRKSFPLYLKHLGLPGAIRTYFLTLLDMPGIDGSTLYIDNVAVENGSRRQGVATAMLSYAEHIALSRKKNKLTLWVVNDNKTAYALYKKMGFYQLAFRSSRIAERYYGYRDWVFMCKDL